VKVEGGEKLRNRDFCDSEKRGRYTSTRFHIAARAVPSQPSPETDRAGQCIIAKPEAPPSPHDLLLCGIV
jgi:hypothetical protein